MRTLAITILIAITFIWGSTFIVVKDAIQHIPPFLFVSLRFFIASLLLLPFLPGVEYSSLKKSIFGGLLVGTALFGGYIFQTMGLIYTTATKSAFITSLSVVLVPFVSLILWRSKPGMREVIALLLALIGLYQLILGPHFHFNGVNKGDVLTFFCALSFAIHISLTGFYTKSIDLTTFTFSQFLYVGVVSLIFSKLFGEPVMGLSGNPLLALLFIGVFATAFAFVGQTWAQRHLKDVHAALIFSLEPVFATIFAVAFGGETLTFSQILGGSLIILGILISEI